MSIKKTYRFLGLMILALTLVLMPGVSRAAMWVGGEIGGNFMANTDVGVGSNVTFSNVKIDPTVIGGVTIGYDFVNAGFLAYNWPDWMKYFGVAVDFTYNNISIRSGQTTAEIAGINILPRPFFGPAQGSRLKGFVAATTFLFYGHYGFFPDSEIPVGRVHPYLGVGPAIVVSGLDLGSYGIGNRSSADVALVVEAGIRWICFKNISMDTAFRYRFAAPSYSFEGAKVSLNDFNSFSFLVRANYHF